MTTHLPNLWAPPHHQSLWGDIESLFVAKDQRKEGKPTFMIHTTKAGKKDAGSVGGLLFSLPRIHPS
jgi:hypothetical protein